ncbi:uncharacterized protein flip [Epargyreus clarus]|uniref:uncharacterized protein flip n=1 Tax=Epargyreus clarus TaxID=520877 RepID=UPI003C2B2662
MSETIPPLRTLQLYLTRKFQEWQPQAPAVVERTKRSVTLKWLEEEPFGFLEKHLLYKVQRKEKIPRWVTVYSGGKTTKVIEDLAPSHPHKFRLQVILKSTALALLAAEALKHYGDESTIYNTIDTVKEGKKKIFEENNTVISTQASTKESEIKLDEYGDHITEDESHTSLQSTKWLESQWSDETWTSTDTDGTSAMCFCMAIRCGYFKQVQIMLEERPILIGAINSHNGLTPVATAVRKGDVNTVKYVLSLGAEVDQPTSAGQTPLHLAVLAGHTAIADLLIEKGANFQVQDYNGLRVEHYAVDSCKLDVVKYIFEKGGDIEVKDSNGWTPLFRAVCQGAKTEVIEELLYRGSNVDVTDRRGLTLVAAARLLRNRQGRSRDSILRLVDVQFPHEKALANFTRLTKKIYSVHTLLK